MNKTWKRFLIGFAILLNISALIFFAAVINNLDFNIEKIFENSPIQGIFFLPLLLFITLIILLKNFFESKFSSANDLTDTSILTLASFKSRFFASIFDTIIILLIFFFLQQFVKNWNIWTFSFLYFFPIIYILLELFLTTYYGQTVGKMIFKIKICKIDGSNIDLKKSTLRVSPTLFFFLIQILIYLVSFEQLDDSFFIDNDYDLIYSKFENLNKFSGVIYLFTNIITILEMMTMFLNKKRQSLNDLIAGTIVIKKD